MAPRSSRVARAWNAFPKSNFDGPVAADAAGQPALEPVELDGAELRGVEIRREWEHIDLLIVCKQPRFVIAVENKVHSGEHDNQLARYLRSVNEAFPGFPAIFVFLTIAGDAPSGEGWVPFSYGDIHGVLARCRRTNAQSIGSDVLAFLEHYLLLIESRFMDDPKIDELCQRIYRNHRRALDLIFDRVDPGSGLVAEIHEFVTLHPSARFSEISAI